VEVICQYSPSYHWYLREDWDNEHPITVAYKGHELDSGYYAISDGKGSYWLGIPAQHHFEPGYMSYYNHIRVIEFPRF